MALSISQVLAEGNLEVGTHYQLKGTGVFGVDVWAEALTMLGATSYPTEQQAAAWAITAQAKVDAVTVVITAQNSLKVKAQLAKTYAAEIGLIFNAITDSDLSNNFASETADACFLRLTGATALGHATVSAGFRSWVMANFTKETRLSFPMTAQGIANAPAATRDAFNTFCRRFFNTWGMMVIYAG